MLNSLRNSVGSIGAKILLGLLVLAFAAWGVEGVFNNRAQTVVATVGDAEIQGREFSRVFENALTNERRNGNPGLTVENARRAGFDQRVLGSLVRDEALHEEALAFGLSASDGAVQTAIKEFPDFQGAYQKFDKSLYDGYLRRAGLRPSEFEGTIRESITRSALQQTVSTGTTGSRALAQVLYTHRNEKRAFEHISLSPADVDDPGEPSAEALSAFHEENAPRFTAPEYRKVSYVALTVEDVANGIEVTDETLKTEYDARISDFTTPERRAVELMVFDTEDEAKDTAKKIADGDSFAKIAEARGLSADDVSLGTVSKQELPGALSDAAFAASETGILDPIATARGWTLLNIKSIEPKNVRSFDEAKDDLKTTLATAEARRALPDNSVTLDDQLAGGAPLREAATESKGRFAEIAAIDATGRDPKGDRVADLPNDPDFLTNIFSAEKGADPAMIVGETGGYFALMVEDITPAALRPIDTIKDEVTGAWEVAEREKALEALTAELKTKLEGGETLADLAKEIDKTVETLGPATRVDRTVGLSSAMLTALFEAEEGDPLEGPASDGLSRLVGTLSEIVPATSEEDEQAIDRLTENYAVSLAQDFQNIFVSTALARHPVVTNQQAVENVFTNSGYGSGY